MNAQSKGAARPTSRWLRLARIAAWIFVLAVIVLFLSAAIQFYASGLAVLSTILPNSNWTVERLRAALIDIGWTPQAYILHYFASTLFSAFWFAIVALLILWR